MNTLPNMISVIYASEVPAAIIGQSLLTEPLKLLQPYHCLKCNTKKFARPTCL